MSKVSHELSPQMAEELQGQSIVFVNARNRESDEPYSAALSWVYATGPETIRFAVDAGSELIRLLGADPGLVLNYIGSGGAWAIKGRAALVAARAPGLTLKMALLEVEVEEVRNVLFYGGKIVRTPAFVKTYRDDLVRKLDEEMKTALLGRRDEQEGENQT